MTWKTRLAAAAIIIALFVGVPAAYLQWLNINLLHDPHDMIFRATVAGAPMTSLVEGWYWQYPTSEGSFDVVCRSGQRIVVGYVTGHMGATLTVGPGCTAGDITQ